MYNKIYDGFVCLNVSLFNYIFKYIVNHNNNNCYSIFYHTIIIYFKLLF